MISQNNSFAFILFTFILLNYIYAQSIPVPQIEFSPKKYICYKAENKIEVDGKLIEKSWTNAEWTGDFIDIEGDVKPKPRFRTRAKMLWDENYFYIAAEMEEPHIWGNLKNRDDIIFYDNDFEVFIDPDGDTHSYCEFEMNALNTVWDLLLIQPYRDIDKAAIHGWDIKGLKSGVSIYGTLNNPEDKDSIWTVEVAFPWQGFKEITPIAVPPENKDQWRINFSRVEWKTEIKDGKYVKQINPATNKSYPEDNWVWSPQGVINMHYPEMWGYVQFSEEKSGGGKIGFVDNPDEQAKWFLRKIYYSQKKYFDTHGVFTSDFTKLDIKEGIVPGYKMPPHIESTTNLFEAWIEAEDGSHRIVISNNSQVRQEKLK